MLRYIPATYIILSFLRASAQTPPYLGDLLVKPALATNKCLSADANTDSASVSIQECTGAISQKWVFKNENMIVFGNKCLTVPGGNGDDGTKLQVSTCVQGNANQLWDYNQWVNQIIWKTHDKCLDLTRGDTNVGNLPSIYKCYGNQPNQIWNVGYKADQLPQTSQNKQYGINSCGTQSSQSSKCQTAWINSAQDFCLWGPPEPNSTIADTEHLEVAWCLQGGRGTRVIPDGTLKGVHFVKTPDYVQITGRGDFTKINIKKGDQGGELDNRGANALGNPAGGLLYGNTFGPGTQYHEWTQFISDTDFGVRACIGAKAMRYCNHIYDLMGTFWNLPGNYDVGVFENCDADNTEPMGVYGTSTYSQGISPTPPPHPAARSSNCASYPTVTSSPGNIKPSRRHDPSLAVRRRNLV